MTEFNKILSRTVFGMTAFCHTVATLFRHDSLRFHREGKAVNLPPHCCRTMTQVDPFRIGGDLQAALQAYLEAPDDASRLPLVPQLSTSLE